MKRLTFVFFALTLCLAVASCGKEYDDTELTSIEEDLA